LHDHAALYANDGIFRDLQINGEVVQIHDAPHDAAVGHHFVAFFQAGNQ
jgi:hypothetical protein